MQAPFLPPIPFPWCSQSLLMKIDAFHYVQLGTAYRSVQTALPDPAVPPPPQPASYTVASAQDHFRLMMSVHPPRGLQPVPDEEVIDLYGGTQHIPLYQMSGFYGKVLAPSNTATGRGRQLSDLAVGALTLVGWLTQQVVSLYQCPKGHWSSGRGAVGIEGLLRWLFPPQGPSIKQFMDIFSLPEMALLSCVVDHFLSHGLEFDQAHLYKDVTVRTLGLPLGVAGKIKSATAGQAFLAPLHPHSPSPTPRMPFEMCT